MLDEVNRRVLLQHDFASAVESLQKRLLTELEESNITAKSYLSRLVESVEKGVHDAFESVFLATRSLEANLDAISQVQVHRILFGTKC